MDAMTAGEEIETIFTRAGVIPVLTISDPEIAVPLGHALAAGGLTVIEVAIRTEASIEALRRMAIEVDEATVGAGTILDARGAQAAAEAGARFLVSPGLSQPVLWAASDAGLPCLPGVQTASEIMRARELGLRRLKFFPAGTSGGAPALKALAGPFPDMRFCPTGGVGPGNLVDYLSLPNVFAAGGSWVAPSDAVRNGDWELVARLSAEAHAAARGIL